MGAHLRSVVVLTLSAVFLSCSSSTEPHSGTTTYVLTEVDGDPLPTVLFTNDVVQVTVLSDTIRLNADGTGTTSGLQRFVLLQPDGPPEGPQAITSPIHYRSTTHGLEIDFDCPANANCAPPPHLLGSITAD